MDLKGVEPRASVMQFARLMETKLRENDHKKHWSEIPVEQLMTRIQQELFEMHDAITDKEPGINVAKEAADVANFAMMVAEKAMGIETKSRR